MINHITNDTNSERWYVLRLPKAGLRVGKEMDEEMAYRKERNLPALRYFAPLFMEANLADGEIRETAKPLCLNYIFMRESLLSIRIFRKTHPDYNLIKDPVRAGGYLFVPDMEMDMFRFIARAYKNIVPCFTPKKIQLSRGDRVRVTGGDFKGVEGTLITQQGRDGGRVVINVCNRLAVPTLNIPPQYIEIIAFADGNKHVYKALDRYRPRIRRAMRNHLSSGIDEEDRGYVDKFISKYSNANIESEKVRGRHLAYLMMSHAVLGHEDETAFYARECLGVMEHITNAMTRAALLTALYACTADTRYLYAARHAVSSCDREQLTETQRSTLDDITFYEGRIHIYH